MKIIEDGRVHIPNDWFVGIIWKCGSCGTRGEIERESDAYCHYWGNDRKHRWIGIQCPVCDRVQYAYSNRVGKPWWHWSRLFGWLLV